MTRQYQIPKKLVMTAWEAVRQKGGCAGYDGKTIQVVEQNLKDELYKIWNRMTSGSYMAQPVKLYQIPKVGGGQRTLGIPTVTDRVAQTIIKFELEPLLEPHFHENSYAYRPRRSAIDAVGKARECCFHNDWVLDMDIQGFFDTIDHDHLMTMVKKYTQNPMLLLYIKRFMKAKGVTAEGQMIERSKGLPQGGVISPLLANLYLHEVFDQFMKGKYPDVKFERYADDIVIHCKNEAEAHKLKGKIGIQLQRFKLELNARKTHIVYVSKHQNNKRRGEIHRKFTFLGFDFKPRKWRHTTVFTPAIGDGALKLLRWKIRKFGLEHQYSSSIKEIAQQTNRVIRGWIQYYGSHRKSALYRLAEAIDSRLEKWVKNKFKETYQKAGKRLKQERRVNPHLFAHWYLIKAFPTRAV
jgi:RNA-directed DNA polymerase